MAMTMAIGRDATVKGRPEAAEVAKQPISLQPQGFGGRIDESE
ncbi:hypothetical protein ACU6VJ_18200 [Sphaerotilus sulfidivorans]|jgi:hypothetical protein|nr:hypothetical protein [Sphaerotilus sp. FB-3]